MHGNTGMVPQSPPVIFSLTQARTSWYMLQGTAYSVCACTSEQFRAWVEQIAPSTWRDLDARDVLAQAELDDFARWYVLVALEKRLVSAGQSLPLFLDAQCKIAFRSKSERAQPHMVQKVITTSSKRPQRVRSKKDVHA
jgi:hypothetical protein